MKNDSDIIAEVEATDDFKKIDYKGTEARITKLIVKDVIKGDKSLKEISIFQSEGVEEEQPPKNGEKLLIFARKGIDFPEDYVVLGGTQGAFRIVNDTLESYKMDNDNILNELPSSYNEAKRSLLKSMDGNEKEIKEIVYNQFSESEKEEIDNNLDQVEISKIILNENLGIISDNSYIGKEVYYVDFDKKQPKEFPNNRVVFVSMDKYKIIGDAFIE